jgi:hypothetical protein
MALCLVMLHCSRTTVCPAFKTTRNQLPSSRGRGQDMTGL